MDLIISRYRGDIYDTVKMRCNSHSFTHETRSGTEIDHYTTDYMNCWKKLCSRAPTVPAPTSTVSTYVPLNFYFVGTGTGTCTSH